MSSSAPKLSIVSTSKTNQKGETDKLDGRRQRSERSRTQILEAMWDLMLEGDMNPSAAAIAERAEIGLRSVFRHFEDIDTIYRELVAMAEKEVMPEFMAPFTSLNWQDQILELVERHASVWERIMIPHMSGEIRRFKSAILMDDYKRARQAELSALKAVLPKDLAKNQNLLLALDNNLSFSTWRRLRQDRNLSTKDAKAVMTHAVSAILADI